MLLVLNIKERFRPGTDTPQGGRNAAGPFASSRSPAVAAPVAGLALNKNLYLCGDGKIIFWHQFVWHQVKWCQWQ
jgi:hypothetical protein